PPSVFAVSPNPIDLRAELIPPAAAAAAAATARGRTGASAAAGHPGRPDGRRVPPLPPMPPTPSTPPMPPHALELSEEALAVLETYELTYTDDGVDEWEDDEDPGFVTAVVTEADFFAMEAESDDLVSDDDGGGGGGGGRDPHDPQGTDFRHPLLEVAPHGGNGGFSGGGGGGGGGDGGSSSGVGGGGASGGDGPGAAAAAAAAAGAAALGLNPSGGSWYVLDDLIDGNASGGAGVGEGSSSLLLPPPPFLPPDGGLPLEHPAWCPSPIAAGIGWPPGGLGAAGCGLSGGTGDPSAAHAPIDVAVPAEVAAITAGAGCSGRSGDVGAAPSVLGSDEGNSDGPPWCGGGGDQQSPLANGGSGGGGSGGGGISRGRFGSVVIGSGGPAEGPNDSRGSRSVGGGSVRSGGKASAGARSARSFAARRGTDSWLDSGGSVAAGEFPNGAAAFRRGGDGDGHEAAATGVLSGGGGGFGRAWVSGGSGYNRGAVDTDGESAASFGADARHHEAGGGGGSCSNTNPMAAAAAATATTAAAAELSRRGLMRDVVLDSFELKVIFERGKCGFQDSKEFHAPVDAVIAGRYKVRECIGTAAFSQALQCEDLDDGGRPVCLKVIKNNKDFFDQSLDEIKLLKHINSRGDPEKHHVLALFDYFYYKEHLFIVSELLRENLYDFGRLIREHRHEPYFTLPRLQKIMRQCLEALVFISSLGILHTDIKPENLVLKSYSRAEVKLIDFGSSCFATDHLSSYVQSRSYRAPEVVLGLPYGPKIDVWSLGAVVAELVTGWVLFQGETVAAMLARIQSVVGPFPNHMLALGREVPRLFTGDNVLYQRISGHDNSASHGNSGGGSGSGEDPRRGGGGGSGEDVQNDGDDRGGPSQPPAAMMIYPKRTCLRLRLNVEDALFLDFVSKLLSADPALRPTAAEALRHPWILDGHKWTDEDLFYVI
ncbi:unnamed protein product, partial [Phaeothamnion confervicola]